jgi:hypothetical protein
MHRLFTRKSQAAALIAALLLAGCAGAFQAQWPVTKQTPTGDALIGFEDPAFKGAATARVSHLGAFEHVEYARFETNGLALEAVYDTVTGDQRVLDYHFTMARMLDTWNANAGQAKNWGPKKTARAWHGSIEYQTYRLSGTGQQCAGFNSEWDFPAGDPQGRPGRVLFGYVCAKPGAALSEARAASLVKGVRIDPRWGETFVKPGTRSQVDPGAVAMAKGTGRPGTGNREFPFSFGTIFTDGGPDFSK